MGEIGFNTVDDVKTMIDLFVPQRDTGGVREGCASELIFWGMFSSIPNIVSVYNYLLATCPLCILLLYVLVYTLLAYYIGQLGSLLCSTDSSSKYIDEFKPLIYTDISDYDEGKKRVNRQTKKSTPPRF